MNLFDILGPVMVGPSSSHTAGAVRLGRTARRLLGEGTPLTDPFLLKDMDKAVARIEDTAQTAR